VLKDQKGELIADVVRQGRPDKGMPALPQLTAADVSDIAAFIHAFPVGSRDPARQRPATIVVGDAKSGAATFGRKCGSCHTVTGDLKALGTRIPDPRQLQQWWLLPSSTLGRGSEAAQLKPVTATIIFPSGQKVEGRLRRIDDFVVTVVLANGEERTIRRDGDVPKVELHDPLQPHRDLLPTYSDTEIHDITAYLVTVK